MPVTTEPILEIRPGRLLEQPVIFATFTPDIAAALCNLLAIGAEHRKYRGSPQAADAAKFVAEVGKLIDGAKGVAGLRRRGFVRV